jgi:ketosteroid isomerase-like protein
MKNNMMAVAMVLTTVFAHAQTNHQIMQQDKEQVLQVHRKIYQAIAGKKGSDLQEMLKPEFIFTSANADVWNKEKFLNGFALHPAIALPLFVTSEENIIIIDNTAICTALAHINIKRGDQPVQELWERVTETYINQLGMWKLLAIQATYVQKN